MTPIEHLKSLVEQFGDDQDKNALNAMDSILSKISSYDCTGCKYLERAKVCILLSGNHCIRRADDFYDPQTRRA